MKDAYYFSHDSNARNDEKIVYLRCKHGLESYGLYWVIIEMMHDTAEGKLSLRLKDAIAWQYNFAIEKFHNVFTDFLESGLFITDGECYWSERVVRNLQQRNEKKLHNSLVRSEAGKKGAEVRWQKIANDSKGIANGWQTMAKGKEIKVKEIKVKNIEEENIGAQKQVFTKPSQGDITNYLTNEKNYDFFTAQGFASRFLDHYDSNGWKVGKNSMKDWRASVRTWISKENDFKNNNHATTKRDTSRPGTVLSAL